MKLPVLDGLFKQQYISVLDLCRTDIMQHRCVIEALDRAESHHMIVYALLYTAPTRAIFHYA